MIKHGLYWIFSFRIRKTCSLPGTAFLLTTSIKRKIPWWVTNFLPHQRGWLETIHICETRFGFRSLFSLRVKMSGKQILRDMDFRIYLSSSDVSVIHLT